MIPVLRNIFQVMNTKMLVIITETPIGKVVTIHMIIIIMENSTMAWIQCTTVVITDTIHISTQKRTMDMVLDTTLTVFTKIIHMMNITQKATGLMLDSMITATTHIHAMVKDGPIVHTQWST